MDTPGRGGCFVIKPVNEGELCNWDERDSNRNTVDVHCGAAAKCGWADRLLGREEAGSAVSLAE